MAKPISASESIADVKLSDFIARLASADPTPGGGSASALAGALGAGLVSMVAELSADRARYAPFAATIDDARTEGHRLVSELLALADRDAAAFAAFLNVAKLPRSTESEREARTQAIARAAREATEPPRRMLLACRQIVELAERLAGRSNLGLSSDLLVASRLAEAAAHGAAENVFVNLPSFTDRAEADLLAADVEGTLATTLCLARAVRVQVLKRHLREPEAPPGVVQGAPPRFAGVPG